jgi:WD40 repeat protein
VISVAFSPDGERVVSGSLDENICIWDITLKEAVIINTDAEVYSVASSHDGKKMASGCRTEPYIEIRIWDSLCKEKPSAIQKTYRGFYFRCIFTRWAEDCFWVMGQNSWDLG